MSATPFRNVFVDTETTGLLDEHEVWEVALVADEEDGTTYERVWYLDVDLGNADKRALDLNRFHERHPDGHNFRRGDELPYTTDLRGFASEFSELTWDAQFWGAVPSFDAPRLAKILRANGACPGWSHRLRCVETLTAGFLGSEVGGLRDCAEALGLDFPEEDQHTALGDARMAKAIHDRILLNSAETQEDA